MPDLRATDNPVRMLDHSELHAELWPMLEGILVTMAAIQAHSF